MQRVGPWTGRPNLSFANHLRGDFGEPLSHGARGDVARSQTEPGQARADVGDAEGRAKPGEARRVVAAVTDGGVANDRRARVFPQLARTESNRAACLVVDVEGRVEVH